MVNAAKGQNLQNSCTIKHTLKDPLSKKGLFRDHAKPMGRYSNPKSWFWFEIVYRTR